MILLALLANSHFVIYSKSVLSLTASHKEGALAKYPAADVLLAGPARATGARASAGRAVGVWACVPRPGPSPVSPWRPGAPRACRIMHHTMAHMHAPTVHIIMRICIRTFLAQRPPRGHTDLTPNTGHAGFMFQNIPVSQENRKSANPGIAGAA